MPLETDLIKGSDTVAIDAKNVSKANPFPSGEGAKGPINDL